MTLLHLSTNLNKFRNRSGNMKNKIQTNGVFFRDHKNRRQPSETTPFAFVVKIICEIKSNHFYWWYECLNHQTCLFLFSLKVCAQAIPRVILTMISPMYLQCILKLGHKSIAWKSSVIFSSFKQENVFSTAIYTCPHIFNSKSFRKINQLKIRIVSWCSRTLRVIWGPIFRWQTLPKIAPWLLHVLQRGKKFPSFWMTF